MSVATDYANGWDVIVAAKQKDINAGLTFAYNDGLLPKDFNLTFDVDFFGVKIPIKLDGVFGAMQMTGGTGTHMDVIVPIQTGTLTVQTTSFDIAGITAILTVDLSYIESPIQPVQGTQYSILIDFTKQNAIVGILLEDVPPNLQQYTAAIQIALADYLRTQTAGKTYTVATVDLKFAAQDFPYLVPNLFEYAISTNTSSADDNIFAVQMLTISNTKGDPNIIAGTVPTSSDAGLIISNKILMSKIILAAVATGFKANQNQFNLVGSPLAITNNTDIAVPNTEHDPVITYLKVEILDGVLDFKLNVTATASPGIHVDYTIHSTYNMVVTTNGNNQSIELTNVLFENSHEVRVEWWVWVVGTVPAILLLPFVGVLGVVLGAAIGASIIAIIQAVVDSKAPNLDASAFSQAAKPVNWNYGALFHIQSVNLPLPLQVIGTIPLVPGRALRPPAHTHALVGEREKVGA